MAKKQLKSKRENKPLIVEYRIKELLKKVDMRVSAEFFEKLNNKVAKMVNEAKNRARSNNRKTVMAKDI